MSRWKEFQEANDSILSTLAGAQWSDAHPIDASAAELGFSVQTCVVVLMIVNARTSKTVTFIRMMRTKVMRMRAAVTQSLSKDAKNCK